MNRLWVRLSLAIAGIVIILSLLPTFLWRLGFNAPDKPPPLPPSEEQIERMQQMTENRIWTTVTRTLIIGGVLGVVAGIGLSRWLVRPLNELEMGAEAIANRQLDYRVPVRGSRETKAVAQAFNQMASDLENGESLRKNMLADITHELRHPIHIIQGNLQAILDEVYPLSVEEIANLSNHTRQLTTLVNDLHELALAEARQLPLHPVPTDLNALTANTIDTYIPIAATQKVALSFKSTNQPLNHNIDPDRFRQVLQNLLSNALQHTAEGGTIIVKITAAPAETTIAISDTGQGIAPQHLPHIFDRFYRADTSRNRGNTSTGLGLAIAQAIIQAHGSEITASSPGEGQGSTFTVNLPRDG